MATALEKLEEALRTHAKGLAEERLRRAEIARKAEAEWRAWLHAEGIDPEDGWTYATKDRWLAQARKEREE